MANNTGRGPPLQPNPSSHHRARPLKFWPFAVVGLTAFAIAKLSLHPRLHFTRAQSGWTLRYEYASAHDPGPADKGLQLPMIPPRDLIAPAPAPPLGNTTGTTGRTAAALRDDSNTRWILDTGATAHMCTNRALMHAYRELPWGQTRRGFTGANGQVAHVVGVGDVTLDVTGSGSGGGGREDQDTEKSKVTKEKKVTLSGVQFYPTQGVNILSWSQLKRAAQTQGLRLRLVEGEDWSLGVVMVEGRLKGRERETLLMRFRLEGGLFVLDQPRKAGAAKIGDGRQ